MKVHGVQYLSPLSEEIHLYQLGKVCLHNTLAQIPKAINPLTVRDCGQCGL